MIDHDTEVAAVGEELNEMFARWADRDADGLVVCTVMLTQFVSMAGHLFDRREDYERFVKEAVEMGHKRFREEVRGVTYTH